MRKQRVNSNLHTHLIFFAYKRTPLLRKYLNYSWKCAKDTRIWQVDFCVFRTNRRDLEEDRWVVATIFEAEGQMYERRLSGGSLPSRYIVDQCTIGKRRQDEFSGGKCPRYHASQLFNLGEPSRVPAGLPLKLNSLPSYFMYNPTMTPRETS